MNILQAETVSLGADVGSMNVYRGFWVICLYWQGEFNLFSSCWTPHVLLVNTDD